MKFLKFSAYIIFFGILLTACSRQENTGLSDYDVEVYTPEYAGGFKILGADGKESTILVSHAPWQGASDSDDTMLFISRNGEKAPAGFRGETLDGDAKRIVVMSSSYIAMLDVLDETDRVVGVSGLGFISNPKIVARRGSVGDVGYDGNFDYERLMSLNPDIVLLYGVDSPSGMEPKLKELGIPFAYIGEYREESPLGKAEWMVAIAEIIGQREKGIERFNKIPENYNRLKALAKDADSRPKVMINTPYRDSWVMPSSQSYAVKLIEDAGAEYVYKGNNGSSSKPIDMEEAFLLTNSSDYWINLGQFDSKSDFVSQFPKLASTKPVITGNIWNTTLHRTKSGGNEYWETGIVYPDRVLSDLIKIFHPELSVDNPFYYYKRL